MNKIEIIEFLKSIKIEDHEIYTGTDNGVKFLYVEISEGRKATIKKMFKYGFSSRSRYQENYKFYKQFSIKVTD